MAKKILSPAPDTHETSCSKCGTRFSYELSDVQKSYATLPRLYVTCPNDKCGAVCAHHLNGEVFYIKVIGYKKGPVLYGPYDKEEWDPEKTLREFRVGLEKGFQAELR